MPDYYIGLISGTSMDGIDAVLVEFGDRPFRLLATKNHPYPPELRAELVAVVRDSQSCTIDVLGRLDHWTGECFRDAVLGLLSESGITSNQVYAIGSHGQTLLHQPDNDRPFTLQIGNPNIIAKGTGIDCVADFRGADIALGGQGAPLVPLYGRSGSGRGCRRGLMRRFVLPGLLALLPLTGVLADDEDARTNYLLACRGCHLADGSGVPPEVPSLRNTLGSIAGTREGRDYLVRVPAVLQSRLDNEQLANVLNWVLSEFNSDTLPQNFRPFSAREVAKPRKQILADPIRYRQLHLSGESLE